MNIVQSKYKNGFNVENGLMTTQHGERQVVLSPTFDVRPVIHAKWSGKLSERHSIQEAFPGDIIVSNDSVVGYQIRHIRSTAALEIVDLYIDDKIWEFLDKHPSLATWLDEADRDLGFKPSMLPVGYGWDGENTKIALEKTKRIRELFKGLDPDLLESIVKQSKKTRGADCPSNWRHAEGYDSFLGALSHAVALPGNYPYQQLILFQKDGVVKTSPITRVINRKVDRMILITWNIHQYKDVYSGIKWRLFKN